MSTVNTYSGTDFIHIVDKKLDLDIWQCINCGAFSKVEKSIKHFPTCKAGEAKKWFRYYAKGE